MVSRWKLKTRARQYCPYTRKYGNTRHGNLLQLMASYVWRLNDDELEIVKEQWFKTCADIIPDTNLARNWWTKLFTRYTESHRHYHTLKHIFFMLDYLTKLPEGCITRQLEVAIAIFFHE